MEIHYLIDCWNWFGSHSAYHQICKGVKDRGNQISIQMTHRSLPNQVVGKLWSVFTGYPNRKPAHYAAAELYTYIRYLSNKDKLIHVLYFDNHVYLWDRWKKAPKNLISTIHHPAPLKVSSEAELRLRKLSSAITLTSVNFDYYESLIGEGNLSFIRHGVDTNFFHPGELDKKQLRILYTGVNGRNLGMLTRVVEKLLALYPEVFFDFLLPKFFRKDSELSSLQSHSRISWHENLSDDQLKNLYQKSYLLLMPFNECTANNAIVEALATGLPIVTTNIGGICDYGGGSIYPTVKNNNDDDMVDLVKQYIEDSSFHQKISASERKFATEHLSWSKISEDHLAFYEQTIQKQ